MLKRVREVYDTDQEAVTKNSGAIMAAMTETQPADGDGVPVITNGILDSSEASDSRKSYMALMPCGSWVTRPS